MTEEVQVLSEPESGAQEGEITPVENENIAATEDKLIPASEVERIVQERVSRAHRSAARANDGQRLAQLQADAANAAQQAQAVSPGTSEPAYATMDQINGLMLQREAEAKAIAYNDAINAQLMPVLTDAYKEHGDDFARNVEESQIFQMDGVRETLAEANVDADTLAHLAANPSKTSILAGMIERAKGDRRGAIKETKRLISSLQNSKSASLKKPSPDPLGQVTPSSASASGTTSLDEYRRMFSG